jgi:hypothetical protein
MSFPKAVIECIELPADEYLRVMKLYSDKARVRVMGSASSAADNV